MTREVLIALISKDIKELGLLTSGFDQMAVYPAPYMQLAIDKANELVNNINELAGLSPEAPHAKEVIVDTIQQEPIAAPSIIKGEEETPQPIEIETTVVYEEIKVEKEKTEQETTVQNTEQVEENKSIEIPEQKQPIQPAQPLIPIEPIQPTEPIAPLEPINPLEDKEPKEQEAPIAPTPIQENPEEIEQEESTIIEEPFTPYTPIAPVQPIEIEEPIAPEIIIGEEPIEPVEIEIVEIVEAPVSMSVADSIKTTKSLLESLHNSENRSFATSIEKQRIADLKTALTIADRFRFQRELFVGNGAKMMEALNDLNRMDNLEQADKYIKKHFSWKTDNQNVIDFMDLVARRFM